MDLAPHQAGLEALMVIMNGVRPPGARLLLGLGVVGDRSDELIAKLGEIGARDSDQMVIAHKERYLRCRTSEELETLMRGGAERVGVSNVPAHATEVEGLASLVGMAEPGDVVGVRCPPHR